MATPTTSERVEGTSHVLRSTSAERPLNGEAASSIKATAKESESAHLAATSASQSHLDKAASSQAQSGDQSDTGVPLSTGSNPSLVDSDGELEVEEEEDLLGTSVEADEVGKLLRTTVSELEVALQESRKLLAERDEELVRLRSELDRYKQQAAREIANKTKVAQALDESHRHARELEELLQTWQLQLRESKLQGERLQAYLQREQAKTGELERRYSENLHQKEKEIEQLKSQLIETRQKLTQQPTSGHRKSSTSLHQVAADSNPGPEGMDESKLQFLKQAVFHLLTDFHADDQLRAIISILDFSAQERKAVYAKTQEKKKALRGLY